MGAATYAYQGMGALYLTSNPDGTTEQTFTNRTYTEFGGDYNYTVDHMDRAAYVLTNTLGKPFIVH